MERSDPIIPYHEIRPSNLVKSWKILVSEAKPRRLFYEDPGVKGPLWFGSNPESGVLHIFANIIRLLLAIALAPGYIFVPHLNRPAVRRLLFDRFSWNVEWSKTPDAILVEAPGEKTGSGAYAAAKYKPNWLLEVEFKDGKVVSQKQVRYEFRAPEEQRQKFDPESGRTREMQELRRRIEETGYTAISYPMKSAEALFVEYNRKLDDQVEIDQGEERKYSLQNRRKISRTLLDEYAKARETMRKEDDGCEFIWLDEFCLSDDILARDEAEVTRQRHMELGQLADIFRGARKVVVFCHRANCDHTVIDCPWGNRLFTLGEILYTPKVLRMTRESSGGTRLKSLITVIPGQNFRADMQANAADAGKWHLYNIMQHATNSGAVPWQSAIHSLAVEAIRRDEADNFHAHKFLGKALNGLLPRRSQLKDLLGVNGWADLAWLLELNQGYYNATSLAAVCKLADSDVMDYRWWGKPIEPREGCERLEPLVTSIPVIFHDENTDTTGPALSVIGPKSIKLERMLQRDSAGLHHQEDMRSLSWYTRKLWGLLSLIGISLLFKSPIVAVVVIWTASISYVIVELVTGTIYVEKSSWIALEDRAAPGGDPYGFLQSQDPTYNKAPEWGKRQLVPKWEYKPNGSGGEAEDPLYPHPLTLIDLRTGVQTKAMVTSRPNDMIVLAVHGYGITCMLLDRGEDEMDSTVAVKVGMANLPPFILAHATQSGTVYVGGGASRGGVRQTRMDRMIRLLTKTTNEIEKQWADEKSASTTSLGYPSLSRVPHGASDPRTLRYPPNARLGYPTAHTPGEGSSFSYSSASTVAMMEYGGGGMGRKRPPAMYWESPMASTTSLTSTVTSVPGSGSPGYAGNTRTVERRV